MIPHGLKIDKYKDGAVFTQILPDDYLQKSKKIRTKLNNIDLRALHPLDIVVSKIGRLNDRDKQDIDACIRKFRLTKNQVQKRAERMQYAGNEDIYNSNLKYMLDNFFWSFPHSSKKALICNKNLGQATSVMHSAHLVIGILGRSNNAICKSSNRRSAEHPLTQLLQIWKEELE